MRRAAPLLLLPLLLLPARAADDARNLVANGGFEEGAADATAIPGWSEVDGLTTFWKTEPGRGRVLMIDTDVNLSEANERWKEMELPPEQRPAAKPKGPTRPPKYDTVGGTTGAKVYSDFFRVEPGMRYRLTVDAKTDGPEVLVFVKGYSKFEGDFRKFYQCYKKVPAGRDEWKTYERTFNPTLHSPEVTHIRVMPYAYWPPGRAWIDDVRVTRVGPEEKGPPAPGTNLLANGGFEADGIASWTAEGEVQRVVRGSEGACMRVPAGGALVSAPVDVEDGRRYVLRARARREKAEPAVSAEFLVTLEGKDLVLDTADAKPPEGTGWVEMEVAFDPTKETPQVARVRVRLAAKGEAGAVLFDDVSLEPLAGEESK